MGSQDEKPASKPSAGEADKIDWGDVVDEATFEQILEMDDDEDEREFSRSIVYDFFVQAEQTFENMEKCMAEISTEGDFQKLSELGHFLKGSSATLGLTKVKDCCERIQHLGARKDETGAYDELDESVLIKGLKKNIKDAQTGYHEAKKLLKKFYNDTTTD